MGKWSREKEICLWQTVEAQKKGTRKIKMAVASMARVPIDAPALGDPSLYLAKGAERGKPELVFLSQTHQGTKFGGRQAFTRAG